MSKKDEEQLMPDASRAEDLKSDEARTAEQLQYFGGTPDEIDSFDPTGLDDGSDLDFKEPEKKDDDDDEEGKKDEELDDKEDGEGKEGEGDDKKDDDDSEDADSDDSDKEDSDADDDSEVDDDAKGDEDDDSEEEDDDGKDEKRGIPRHRFNEVNERAKTAEVENAALKAQIAAGKTPETEEDKFDLDAAETEYMELLLDGKTTEALAKRKEIREAEKLDFQVETTAATDSKIDIAAVERELASLSGEAEHMYPVFDENHEDFDPGLTERVLVYYQGYVASGKAKTSGDAFVMALADVITSAGLDEKYGEKEPDPKDDKGDDPNKDKPTGKKKVDKKKGEARKKAHQPVAGEGASADDAGLNAMPDIEQMTDDEIDALPAKTLAKMRGDFYEGSSV